MRANEFNEAWPSGSFPKVDQDLYLNHLRQQVKGAVKVKDIKKDAAIYKRDDTYFLVKDSVPVGNMILSPITIQGVDYYHVDGLMVADRFKKSAAGWFVYGVKELADLPLVADGAIFKDGCDMILKHRGALGARQLDKITGKKTPLDNTPINDSDKCYVFDSVGYGFKHQVTESMWVWSPILPEF